MSNDPCRLTKIIMALKNFDYEIIPFINFGNLDSYNYQFQCFFSGKTYKNNI